MCRNLSYYCLLAPHIYIFVLCAHPVRGESHNQRNTTGEFATPLVLIVLKLTVTVFICLLYSLVFPNIVTEFT